MTERTPKRLARTLAAVAVAGSLAVIASRHGLVTSTTGYGTDLHGMADRLAAVGGDVAVSSAPGAGTTITGTVPVAEGPR